MPEEPPTIASAPFMVVGIGASAGGLEACADFMDALPPKCGIAFILIQHLDPTRPNMTVELLATHTSMSVAEATDGMRVAPNHLYIIPPGADLCVKGSALQLCSPIATRGARLPFDFLLRSLASEYGALAACVILSGTGTDGSIGLKFIKERTGLVFAQAPNEAKYGGMPESAIATGSVDLVLTVDEIAEQLCKRQRQLTHTVPDAAWSPQENFTDLLSNFIELLRTRTAYDFTSYKHGTLRRRIERRLALMPGNQGNLSTYLEMLRQSDAELNLLAKDLLINVTKFFRDRSVFAFLAEIVIPDLILNHPSDQPLRIWTVACSTGEETYSLAMLFREALTKQKRNIRVQIFASDVDPDAIEIAREGIYPRSIEAEVAESRLERFFSKCDHGYRISSDLRALVIFTVQDVLADTPFSRIDLISCRNLLIYLRPEAQAKVISIFNFALRERGILLLGSSENLGDLDRHFEMIAKPERIYRHIGRDRAGGFGVQAALSEASRLLLRPGQNQMASRQTLVAELCRRLVTEMYAPAAVLINRRYECLYFLGPTDQYLRVPTGQPTVDLLAMAPDLIRSKLRGLLQKICAENVPNTVVGSRITESDGVVQFCILARPILSEGEELILVCFVDEPKHQQAIASSEVPEAMPRIAELEYELAATRSELKNAIHNLHVSSEEQKAFNEEALSVNQEYQSTNEELLTSKEELQSLNEELNALNSQLQDSLERQLITSDDLQNVLYSTDVATLFLDTHLNIRLFTPATKLLFSIIASDIGRPLSDLNSLATDGTLLSDSRVVLQTLTPIEREIEAQNGVCFMRRILPYRTHDNGVEGVVITFTDFTQLKQIARALEAAKQQAILANVAKSRFLAAASHDLRQPLQTLKLLQASLARTVEGGKSQNLVARLGETLSSMAGMLNTLLDINQIEAGIVRAEVVNFPLNDLLDRLRNEFAYHARADGLHLSVVPCHVSIKSDPHLLEQMLRNLIANALKYTPRGKVLIGCRRHKDLLSIEIWDTGIGIAAEELHAIFEEYHQLDNAARERSRGLGLGLSIVQRLANLLDHRIRVRSYPNKGSVFWIEVPLASDLIKVRPIHVRRTEPNVPEEISRHRIIWIVEDDPDARELLEMLLNENGYKTVVAADGVAALALSESTAENPDLILTDYNLPNGLNGLEFADKLRENIKRMVPVIVLTGDTSTETLHNIANHDCVRLTKPVDFKALMSAITRQLLPSCSPSPRIDASREDTSVIPTPATVFIVDDDHQVLEALREIIESDNRSVKTFSNCEAFLEVYQPRGEACILIDAYLPTMTGIELLRQLRAAGHTIPAIMITGSSDVQLAVQAMKAGASDFIEKPISGEKLLESVGRALEQSIDSNKVTAWHEDAAQHLVSLTMRQRQIMELVLAGKPNKIIASDLGISQRTVENHRASIMKKTGSKSLPALARLALAALPEDKDHPDVRRGEKI